ncbi:MAG TPA: response regulator [Gammaproteobacteria bacterium]|nr:response regulator [Gammaproteobacteria bacterium]
MEATNADTHLALMRSCAEALLPSDIAAAHEVFAKLAPALELDAFAAFVPTSGEHALTFETSSGVMETAISATAISTIVAGLERDGRRMLVLDALARNSDSRAPPFHDLGFASVIVGALMTDGRLLGAIVLASRSRERFAAAELTLIDAVVCCLAAAYERRDLARHRSDSENRKQKFLNVLAHELRNPLAPLRNALEIIRADDRMRSAVEHSAYAMIERQLQQIGRLADDLLDANQVILGQVELTKRRVLLDAVVERAAAQSRPWVEAARHSLVIDLPREAIALDADAKRLSRALSNLINNAARRMDRGGRIVLSAESFNSTATVFVRARGRTLSRQALKGLFVDDDTYDGSNHGASQSGVAAGMTLVKHLVELHGGIVTARIGGDAVIEFEVQLPIFHAALPVARKSARPPVDEEAETIPHRILIADDNADSAESMGMLLRLMGNDVRIANDGLEAVEQAATFQPDIVLMDIGMPRLDGYEAARRIRNQEWSRDTLLVAVTGWGPSDDNAEATAAGFDRHFTKPLDPAELRRLVSAVRPH